MVKPINTKMVLKEKLERNSKILKRTKKVKVSPQIPSRIRILYIPRPDVLHQYLRHREINQYLDYIQHRYSKNVKIHDLGLSYESRPLKAIEIDYCTERNTVQRKKKRVKSATGGIKTKTTKYASDEGYPKLQRNIVFIEGGAHAREWITISVALNIIHQLTEKNGRHRDVLDKLRFFIVPIVNPDGYEYSIDKNRYWRKNRRPQNNTKHIGADCNRNYDIFWKEGSSKVQRNTYRGDKPFSEPETRAIRNILRKLGPELLFFLSLHSYAQSIMYPWGFTNELPSCWEHLNEIASAGRKAIREHSGRRYRCGTIARLQQHTISGSVVDYAYGILKVPVALVMELPSIEYGFQPPLELIDPIGQESWLGVKAMCLSAHKLAEAFDVGNGVAIDFPLPTPTEDKKDTIKTKNSKASSDTSANDEKY